jgi:hypothetical protein
MISDLLDYYDEHEPESSARVIDNLDLDTNVEYDRGEMEKIHERFIRRIKAVNRNIRI